MARRVHFHIGVPKSGTTFLQTAMWHNRRPLRAQGVLYPGSRRMDHYHAALKVRGASAARLGTEAKTWDRLVAQLSRWDGEGFLSHEFFCMATPKQIRRALRALEPAEINVIVTARDYVRQFPAVWQERLKVYGTLSLDEYMERLFADEVRGPWGWRSQDLPAVLRRWSKVVPPENIHIVTAPPPGAPRDVLWRRWCEVLQIDDSQFDMEMGFGNESLGAPQAALMHYVKPYLTGSLQEAGVRHRWVRKYFGHEVLVPQRGERYGLRPDQAAHLRKLSIEAVEELRRVGYPVTGDLADLVPDEHQPERPHPDDVTDSEMLEVAARAIDQMIRDVRDLTNERDELRERADHAPRAGVSRLGRRVKRLTGRRHRG
jgi:hypothetical protein